MVGYLPTYVITVMTNELKNISDRAVMVDRYNMMSFPQVSIVRQDYMGGDSWSIEWLGYLLSRGGKWIYNPLPSSRTAAFKKRTRYPLDEAIQRAADHCRKQPVRYRYE